MIRRIFGLCTMLTLLAVASVELGSSQAHAQYYPSWGYGYGYAPGPFFTSWRPTYAPRPYFGGGYYSAGYYGTRVVGYGGSACCSPCDPCGGCNSCDPCGLCSSCGSAGCATGACGVSSGTQNMKPETDPAFDSGGGTEREPFDPPPARTYEDPDSGRGSAPDTRNIGRDGLGGSTPADDFSNSDGLGGTGGSDGLGGSSGPGGSDGLGGDDGTGRLNDGLGGGDFERFRADDEFPPFDAEDDSRTSNKPPMTEPQAGDEGVNLPDTSTEDDQNTGDDASGGEGTEESAESTEQTSRQRHLLLSTNHGRHSEVVTMQRLATRRPASVGESKVAQGSKQKPMRWISAPRDVTRL